jgi:branched-chain amino acid transport system substrate-binding protein
LTKNKPPAPKSSITATGMPDRGNLLKLARTMGIVLPFANLFIDDPNTLNEIGVEGTKGLVHMDHFDMPGTFKNPGFTKFYRTWSNLQKTKWKPPYNSILYTHVTGGHQMIIQNVYWIMSVIERAKSLDPEKIIKVWEGDTYRFSNSKIAKMLACDHKAIQDFMIAEYVPPEQQKISFLIPPYYW